MAKPSETQLDADELLHLALAASKQGRSEDAVTFLKRALALAPKDARLHYMLGAEHAQIGLYDRAVEEMKHAVTLDPSLDAAHFQLGLLHLTSGRADAAADAWAALDKHGQEHPFVLFKTGLLHLAKDEFKECEACLRRGIAANHINLPLNNDMARILNDVTARLAAPSANVKIPALAQTTSKDVLLSAYRKNRPEDKDS